METGPRMACRLESAQGSINDHRELLVDYTESSSSISVQLGDYDRRYRLTSLRCQLPLVMQRRATNLSDIPAMVRSGEAQARADDKLPPLTMTARKIRAFSLFTDCSLRSPACARRALAGVDRQGRARRDARQRQHRSEIREHQVRSQARERKVDQHLFRRRAVWRKRRVLDGGAVRSEIPGSTTRSTIACRGSARLRGEQDRFSGFVYQATASTGASLQVHRHARDAARRPRSVPVIGG